MQAMLRRVSELAIIIGIPAAVPVIILGIRLSQTFIII